MISRREFMQLASILPISIFMPKTKLENYIENNVKRVVSKIMKNKGTPLHSISNTDSIFSLGGDYQDSLIIMVELEEQYSINVPKNQYTGLKNHFIMPISEISKYLTNN